MKVVPLNDKIVVKRLEAEEKTAGGIVLPDTAKEKPKQGKVLSLGDGKLLENGKRRRLPGQGRRPRPVHLLRRQRSDHGRRRVPHHDRGRHPRRRGVTGPNPGSIWPAGRLLRGLLLALGGRLWRAGRREPPEYASGG